MIQNKPFLLFRDKGVETRTRRLRFDMNAMGDFEQLTGMGLAQLMQTRAIFAATRALLWAGLKHEDRRLDIEMVGNLMQGYVENGGDIADLLDATLTAAIEQKAIKDIRKAEDGGEEVETDRPNPTKESPTTGTTVVHGPVTSEPSSFERTES